MADHQRVWLSSGNWNNSNQPDIDPVNVASDQSAARSGDRDWHVVIDGEQLAVMLEAFIGNDLAVAAAHQRPALAASADAGPPAVLAPDAQTPPFAQFWAPTKVSDTMTITPVLTPDPGSYAAHITALIASATTSLDMQFQYIELPKDISSAAPEFLDLLAAIADRQNNNVAVRIIMSEYETKATWRSSCLSA